MFRVLICLLTLLCAGMPVSAALLDVEAENVQKKEGRIEAFGNVAVSGEDIKLKANYVVYDTDTDDLWAVGGCRLLEKTGEINAESLYYNVKRRDFRLEKGSVFIYAQPVIISGESITRYGMDQYEGEDIEFTPCLGTPPAWSLAAGSFEAPVEKYGNATDARFRVKEFPIFYFPYLYFPVKLQRQSGFLLPSVSHATDYGYRFALPYYQVLGRSADATFTPNFLTSRGLLLSGEYRYRLDTEQYGEVYGETLPRDSKGGDTETGDILDTVPDSRWLFRSFQTGGDLTWDVKLVSNPDYFRDIGPMYPGGNIWQETIVSTTGQGRSIEELVSRGQWINHPDGFTANLAGRWKQDLTEVSNEKTLQELPQVTLRMNQRAIPGSPLYVSSQWDSSYLYSGNWVEEFKNMGQAQLSLPMTVFPYLTVMPSYTQYYRDAHITSNPDEFQSSEIKTMWENQDPALTAHYSDPEFMADNPGLFDHTSYAELWERRDLTVSTTLYSGRFLNGLYHQMVPTADWTYFSRQGGNYDTSNASDIYPEFFPEDVWQQQNQLSLGVYNYFRDHTGRALVEVDLARIYDYLLNQWDYYEANIVIEPEPWISLRHMNRFGQEPHPYATIEHWTRLTLRDSNGDELYASEEYHNPDTKTVLVGVKANVLSLGLSGRYETSYDFVKDRYIRTRQGVTYTSQCWNAEVYRDVDTSEETLPRDTTVGVTVNLMGLGQVIHTRRSVTGQSGE